jgi:hypothetical protein
MVLAHDLTKIVPGEFKGAAFKKGYIIKAEDIDTLKDMGKYNVFVVTLDSDEVHENVAARRVAAAAAGKGVGLADASEGKVNIKAEQEGLLKVNTGAMEEINLLGKLALVSLHGNSIVKKGQVVAAAKIIPLTIELNTIEKVEEICSKNEAVIKISPLHSLKAGIIITGSEVYYGRIKDKFGGILEEKINSLGGQVLDRKYAPDDAEMIYSLISEMIEKGAEIILVSGGMAVDADDVTPKAIEHASTRVVTYGLPLLPGAMCMIAYHNDVPIIGVPACGMYHKTTVLDVLLPRFFAKENVTKEELVKLAHGGICLHCEVCHYPVCPFGR